MSEPVRDLAHLSHIELFTPTPGESLAYFRELLGMEVAGERGDSVYLRCFGDYETSSLKLTASASSGVGHMAYRTASPEALERRVAALTAGGVEGEWLDGDLGHGRAYSFLDADGHRLELFYASDRYVAPPALRPALKNQPNRYPNRGVGVRHLDHVNLLAVDPGAARVFCERNLGLRLTEQIVLDDGSEAGVWLASNQKSYDLTYTRDATGARGRLHHIAFFCDQREDVLRAADIFLEAGIVIESGPHKHAIQQTFFLYTYEPGGNRIEVCAGGFLLFDPEHEPVVWTQAERGKGQAWGMQTVPSFHIKGTPPDPGEEELLERAAGH
ncbi:MAG TPA: VOC family protein [Gaiellales bacterium]|jgi:catechol 2,3-dioxygenase